MVPDIAGVVQGHQQIAADSGQKTAALSGEKAPEFPGVAKMSACACPVDRLLVVQKAEELEDLAAAREVYLALLARAVVAQNQGLPGRPEQNYPGHIASHSRPDYLV